MSLQKITSIYLTQVFHNTFAAIEGEESYQHLKEGFKPVLDELNTILANPTITVGSHVYPLNVYLGGDYKV